MLTTCSVCGGIHHDDNMCKRRYKKNSYASKFRNSNAWITKREQIKKRDKYLCQVCLKDNIYTCNNLQVHHIVPIEKDNDKKLDIDNLITLCSYHHKQAEMNKITVEELSNLIDILGGYVIQKYNFFHTHRLHTFTQKYIFCEFFGKQKEY